MPRSKNPKPQQRQSSLTEDEKKRCISFLSSDIEDYTKATIELTRSLSHPSLTHDVKEEMREDDLILSKDCKDYRDENAIDNELATAQRALAKNDAAPNSSSPDMFPDKQRTEQKCATVLEDGSSVRNKTRRLSLGLLNPNILTWFRKRFTLRESAKTSASQIIKLYEKELQGEFNVPLQSYQVGQLLRRIFPDIQRCKITVNGKRVWVYKHLCILDSDTSSSEMEPAINQQRSGVDSDERNASLISNRELSFSSIQKYSPSPTELRNDRKQVKHSAILYNLLYPHQSRSTSMKELLSKESSGKTAVDDVEKLVPCDIEPDDASGKCLQREENVIQWLRDNYEYANGYFVKSLDVLKKYNHGRETLIKYLSQVGRVIKYVFPNARHLRRSLKGGKREWVYHNIRPKDFTNVDVWQGSTKNLSRDDALLKFDMRPSLVPFTHFSHDQNPVNSGDEDCYLSRETEENGAPSNMSFRDRDGGPSGGSGRTETDSFRSEDGSLFNSRSGSARSTPTPNSSSVFFKSATELQERYKSCDDTVPSFWAPYAQGEGVGNESDCETVVQKEISVTDTEKKTLNTPRKLLLEQQINRLKDDTTEFASSDFRGKMNTFRKNQKEELSNLTQPVIEQAEDLRMPMGDHGKVRHKRSAAEALDSDTGLNSISPHKQVKLECSSQHCNENQITDLSPKRAQSRTHSMDHNYSSMHVDHKVQAKGTNQPSRCSINDMSHLERQHPLFNRGVNLPTRINGRRSHPLPEPRVQNKTSELLQWEDLSLCGAHRHGWTLTPTLNNDIPSNFIEWVLFEGQVLRDGQRVFRELKIYDDWSVTIHAMGKKVFPDDLGGIIDLMRTRESVSKVFATLASARTCRGLPALCLSDLCVRGVIVAKSEIWSSREDECEDLRHRAINCQILYRGNEDACPKCIRVIRMHSQNVAAAMGSNGFSDKNSARFPPRPSNSF